MSQLIAYQILGTAKPSIDMFETNQDIASIRAMARQMMEDNRPLRDIYLSSQEPKHSQTGYWNQPVPRPKTITTDMLLQGTRK